MAVYAPVFVDNKLDLRCAVKNKDVVIVNRDQAFFEKMDKEVSVSKGVQVAGRIGLGVGAVVGVVATLGLGAVIVGGSALGLYYGNKLKDYTCMIDYAERRVILLRKHKPNKFDENLDTIEGIDLNAIAIKRG